MKNVLKVAKIIMLLFLCICIPYINCKSVPRIYKAPRMPRDFNFVYNFGYNAINEINTFKGTYKQDMADKPPVTIQLKFSNKELKDIYSYMMKINILKFPSIIKGNPNVKSTPFYACKFKIQCNGQVKNIIWKNMFSGNSAYELKLRALTKKIQSLLYQKAEYKKMRKPTKRRAYNPIKNTEIAFAINPC